MAQRVGYFAIDVRSREKKHLLVLAGTPMCLEAVAAAWLEFKRKCWASETHRKAEYVVNEYLIPKLNGKPIASLGTPDAAAALTFVAASSSNLAEKARQTWGYFWG